MIGQTIAHYEVLDRLGGGGMGVVYKARDRRLGRTVALKFLSPGLVESPTAKQRFVAEAQAASALDHPNIGTIHAIEETPEGDLFIAMAFYEGETVAQRIARGPLPAHEAVELAAQAADGLARAHERDIVHRDVKPANLVVTRERVVKVLDFGLAKVGDIRLTDAGTTLGTPAYMSPEQAGGRSVDHRTDIWSLGVVLYEMLTGRLPFPGESRSQVIDAILGSEPEPLRLPAGAPTPLERLVQRALAKTPARRHPTMAAMFEELAEIRRELFGFSALDTLAGVPTGDETPTIAPPSRSHSAPASGAQPSGERRQVTVLACEMVPFLTLTEELDPEDLQEILKTYHEAAVLVVAGLDGRVVKTDQGQILAHFGFPTAHEDDAHRAVRAGLGIVAAMRAAGEALRTTAGRPLPVRAAVHTGRMVAGDGRGSSADPSTLVGNVPAIAARLQDAAPDDSVVVSGDTRRLVKRFYDLEPLGERQVAGLARPVGVFHVRLERVATDRVDAAQQDGLTPFVGREQELALLMARWEQVKEGEGQVVLLAGEAGIGKSRLALEARERLRDEPHLWLECRASPYHTGDALHPVTEMLGRLAGFADGSSPEDRQERLEETLRPYEPTPEKMSLLAGALSLPTPEGCPEPPASPQRRMQRTMEVLAELVLDLSTRQPVFFVVEDLHWVDPSTEELLGQLVAQSATVPLLVLATTRPGLSAPWLGEDHTTRLALSRLSRAHTQALVAQVASDSSLDTGLLEQLVSRTDGVPLFAEELTRAVCESPRAETTSKTASGVSPAPEVPATLQESLAARLDQLGSAKGVAQMAATLGREFPHRWLEALWPHDPDALGLELVRVVESGLLQRRGVPPTATYVFKHALVQEAAYGSLLRSTRQQYHERIARALEERFAETAANEPHLIAHHYGEAGQVQAGIEWWSRAAEREVGRFANREAAAAVRRALALLAQQPEGPERDGQELGLQMRLATILPSVSGYASEETERAHLRAQELCDRMGPVGELYWVLYGLWAFYFVSARLGRARDQAEILLPLGDERGDALSRMGARYASGVTRAFVGELHLARQELEETVAIDEAAAGRTPDFSAGMELGVTTPAYLAMVLWLLGHADLALERIEGAVERARGLGHPLTLGFALYYLVWIHVHRGEAGPARERAQELLGLSEEHGLFFGPLCLTLLGWALDQPAPVVAAWSATDSPADAPDDLPLDHVRGGLQFYRATGSVVSQTHMLSLLALGHARRGQWTEARPAVDQALGFAEETGETWWTPELHRLAGEITLAEAGGEDAKATEAAGREAEASFRRGLQIAGEQHALALELRAATSLARLLESTDRGAEGLALLRGVLDRLSEGEGTGDVEAAKALLSDLSRVTAG
jgi:TOMM system kinase/cyclase fusion protein